MKREIVAVQCATCKHFHRDVRDRNSCDAFDLIPHQIILAEHDHRKPYPGDRGIRYEPIPDAAELDAIGEP